MFKLYLLGTFGDPDMKVVLPWLGLGILIKMDITQGGLL